MELVNAPNWLLAEDLLEAWQNGNMGYVKAQTSNVSVGVLLYFGYLLGQKSQYALYNLCESLEDKPKAK